MSKEKPQTFSLAEAFAKPSIEISIEEYAKLKDIQTRFTILKQEMMYAEYCPIHHQIILGIEKEYKPKDLNADLLKN